MIKKLLACGIAAMLCVCALCACSPGTEDGDDVTEPEGREILSDTSFKDGIAVSNLDSRDVATTQWKYSGNVESSVAAAWSLGQYCDLSTTRDGYDSSVNDLSLGTIFDDPEDITGIESVVSDGVYSLTNHSGSKEIVVDTNEGSVELNADTSKEYIDENGDILPRRDGEDWVHMILGQAAGGVRVADYSEVRVRIEFTVTEWELFDRTGGASQFQWIFSIKDYESDVGDYFWFNMTFFDDRYTEAVFPGNGLYDGGKDDATDKYIYAPSGSHYSEDPIKVGQTYKVDIDIKPLVKEAFDDAKAKGALEQSAFENMGLNSLNIGWEVTDVAKVGVKIKGLSLWVAE